MVWYDALWDADTKFIHKPNPIHFVSEIYLNRNSIHLISTEIHHFNRRNLIVGFVRLNMAINYSEH